MKNIFLLAVIALTIFSCKEVETTEKLNDDRSSVMSTPYFTRAQFQDLNLTETRDLYNAITPSNRYDLWLDKFQSLSTLNLTIVQQDLIDSVVANMSIASFDFESPAHTSFTTVYLSSIQSQLASAFSNTAGLSMFYNLYDVEDISIINVSDEDTPDCDCNESSAFGGCQALGNSCLAADCRDKSWTCGFMGLFRCNGGCDDVPQPNGGIPQLFH